MNLAKFLSLDYKDIIKGIVVAIITSGCSSLLVYLNAGAFPTLAQWHLIAMTAVAACISYLVKNFFTNSNDQLFVPEPKPISSSSVSSAPVFSGTGTVAPVFSGTGTVAPVVTPTEPPVAPIGENGEQG